jgi:uncharacterized protein YggE
MDTSISVSIRGLLTTGMVLLALLVALAVAYLLGAERGDAAPPAAPTAATGDPAAGPNRTLTMVGTGTATAVPDKIAFDVSVGLTRDDLDSALDETSTIMKSVLAVLEEQGVDRADVRTTGLGMNPVYDYEQNTRVFRGYRVSQQLAVVADLKGAGDIVPAIIAAAGNAARVGDLSLQVGDPESVLAEARADAVAQARAKAEEYAEATGQALGEVITLTEVAPDRSDRDQLYELSAYRSAAVADSQSLPVRAGESDLVARVQVVWQLQ